MRNHTQNYFSSSLSQIPTLRGTIMEESIPSSMKAGTNKGIPPREVMEYITQGELQQLSSLKLAKSDDKVIGSLYVHVI